MTDQTQHQKIHHLLGLSFLLFALAACSDASRPLPDGGDGGSDSSPTDGDPPDSSPTDGTHPDEDGGDGGAPTCDEAPHDVVLGTARLGAAYRVVDSAVLPVTSWLPVAVIDEASADGGIVAVVYGYNGDGRMHRLGVWPDIVAPDSTNEVFDAVSQADRALQVLTVPLVATTHGQMLAGYRTVRGGAFVGGGVSLFDTAQPGAGTRWLAASGMEAALGLGSYFLVGGDGLGGAGGGRGVYAVNSDDLTPRPGLVATYPTIVDENVRPGLMAVTSNGVVVVGHYLDLAGRHSVRLPEPSLLSAALSGGAPVDLSAAPELTQADDVANLASFGHGVAVLHTRKVRGVLPALGRLDHYPLSRTGGGVGTAVGAPVTVLSAFDEACTVVSQLVPVTGGVTLIVGLWDRNGQRLVRLAPR